MICRTSFSIQAPPSDDWLAAWLDCLHPKFRSKYYALFEDNGYDSQVGVKALGEAELQQIGVLRGHVPVFMTAIAGFSANNALPAKAAPTITGGFQDFS